MTTEKRYKKEKEIAIEFEGQVKDIRQQLNEQLKCLDLRLDMQLGMLTELQEFFRRRAEMEQEYSKCLDRLVKQLMQRHKAEKQKRENWPVYSTYACWQHLMGSTKKSSQDHNVLSELYGTQMVCRINEIMEDIQRVYLKCRNIVLESHEEIMKVLNELQNAMKTYQIYYTECKHAEDKLKLAESQKMKLEQHASKGAASRKYKTFEKQTEKRQAKYVENKFKALKARNEYLLSIDAANSAVQKYFLDDIADIIDAMDCGYHLTLARTMQMHTSADEKVQESEVICIKRMNKCIEDLDQRTDKQRFFEENNQIFTLPRKFEFQAHKGDEVCQVSAQQSIQDELLQRHCKLTERLEEIKLEADETWKTLEHTEKSLVDMLSQQDYDVSSQFNEEKRSPKSPHENAKKRMDRVETESFYLGKFKQYLTLSNLITRLQARHSIVQKALGDGNHIALPSSEMEELSDKPPSLPPKPKKRRFGKNPVAGTSKLFGGNLEEFIEATGEEIPLVVWSCVRTINLYGMHHQGIFRISGSQQEINEFKNAFEKGDDPFLDILDSSDMNCVAGVLKLYFRELKEPLFPVHMFDELIAASRLEDNRECIDRLRELVSTMPRSIFVVMRYLFAFLHHLTESSDENMMDSYNLAICFGPTLVPIPPDRDQVQFQSSVNELIKIVIIHQEELFPNDGLGVVYERCMTSEDPECEQDDNLDNISEEGELDNASEEDVFMEADLVEAVAQFDFQGRTDRELSFKKGDVLVVYKQASDDWWQGALDGREGLIPDRYVSMRLGSNKDEEKNSTSEDDKDNKCHSLPANPYGQKLVVENLDKSASLSNIAAFSSSTNKESSKSDTRPSSLGSYTSKDMVVESIDDMRSETFKSFSTNRKDTSCASEREIVRKEGKIEADFESSEDINEAIDSALAEVKSGLESLKMQHRGDTTYDKPTTAPSRHTPDLVLDLPAESTSLFSESKLDRSKQTTEDVFAESKLSATKKASSMPRDVHLGSSLKEYERQLLQRSFSSNATMKNRAKLEEMLQKKQAGQQLDTEVKPPLVAKVPPSTPEKPKPLFKLKPHVMKKPEHSPEFMRKLAEREAKMKKSTNSDGQN